jgi:hypothetical protein
MLIKVNLILFIFTCIAWPIQYIHTYINKTEVVSKSLTIKHVQEKTKLDWLREDDTNGGIKRFCFYISRGEYVKHFVIDANL